MWFTTLFLLRCSLITLTSAFAIDVPSSLLAHARNGGVGGFAQSYAGLVFYTTEWLVKTRSHTCAKSARALRRSAGHFARDYVQTIWKNIALNGDSLFKG